MRIATILTVAAAALSTAAIAQVGTAPAEQKIPANGAPPVDEAQTDTAPANEAAPTDTDDDAEPATLANQAGDPVDPSAPPPK